MDFLCMHLHLSIIFVANVIFQKGSNEAQEKIVFVLTEKQSLCVGVCGGVIFSCMHSHTIVFFSRNNRIEKQQWRFEENPIIVSLTLILLTLSSLSLLVEKYTRVTVRHIQWSLSISIVSKQWTNNFIFHIMTLCHWFSLHSNLSDKSRSSKHYIDSSSFSVPVSNFVYKSEITCDNKILRLSREKKQGIAFHIELKNNVFSVVKSGDTEIDRRDRL